jgi:hypothetical protein
MRLLKAQFSPRKAESQIGGVENWFQLSEFQHFALVNYLKVLQVLRHQEARGHKAKAGRHKLLACLSLRED